MKKKTTPTQSIGRKPKVPTFAISFDGIDKVLTGVIVKEIPVKHGIRNWALLEKKGDGWLLLTAPGYLVEPLVDEPQVLTFNREDPTKPFLNNFFLEKLEIKMFTWIKSSKSIYMIDEFKDGTRIQCTAGFLDADLHNSIRSITVTKEI